MRANGPIIAAVDPFGGDEHPAEAWRAVRRLASQSGRALEAVFVLGGAGRGVGLGRDEIRTGLPAAERELERYVRRAKLPTVEARVLVQRSPFVRDDVKVLLAYAVERGASMVAAIARRRTGIDRFALGSFLELLTLRSSLPVLGVGPRAASSGRLSPILFPTDFGAAAELVLDEVVALAGDLKARLVLFHHHDPRQHPWEPPIGDGAPELKELEPSVMLERCKARSGALRCTTAVGRGSHGVARAIVDEARACNAGLIAMAAVTGPWAAHVIGSTPLRVLREAPCPVLIHYVRRGSSSR